MNEKRGIKISNLQPFANYYFKKPIILLFESDIRGVLKIGDINFVIKASSKKGVILRAKRVLAMLIVDMVYGEKRSYVRSKFKSFFESLEGTFKEEV